MMHHAIGVAASRSALRMAHGIGCSASSRKPVAALLAQRVAAGPRPAARA